MLHHMEPKMSYSQIKIGASYTFFIWQYFFSIQIVENCAGCFELTLEVLCYLIM